MFSGIGQSGFQKIQKILNELMLLMVLVKGIPGQPKLKSYLENL